jgi:hypothetical protein
MVPQAMIKAGRDDSAGGEKELGGNVVAHSDLDNLSDSIHAPEWATVLAQRTAVTRAANFDTDKDGMPDANTINFSLTNTGGTIAPGSDTLLQQIALASMPDITGATETVQSFVGTTHVVGSLTLQFGLLQIDLASLSSFDKINIDAALALGGNLGVVLDNGYAPTVGSEWLIGTAGSISGEFDSITPGFGTRVDGGSLYLTFGAAPEPASLGMLSLAGLILRTRRRRDNS